MVLLYKTKYYELISRILYPGTFLFLRVLPVPLPWVEIVMSDIVHFPFTPFNHSILIVVCCGNFDISQPFFLNLHKISLSIILAVF